MVKKHDVVKVTSWQKRIMISRSQLTVMMRASCPWSHVTGKECNVLAIVLAWDDGTGPEYLMLTATAGAPREEVFLAKTAGLPALG